MSDYVLEPVSHKDHAVAPGRRQHHSPDDALILTPLNPSAVVDHLDPDNTPVELITFGTVRETCPQCQHTHLRLVLRQRRVRLAHLFCAECHSCFDAHYANGSSALTI